MLIVALCGLGALIPGLMIVFGFGDWVHDILNEPVAGFALIGIGLCVTLSAVFPILVRLLTEREKK